MVLNIPRILEYSWSTFDFFETAYCAIIHEDEIQIEPIDVFAFFLLDEIGMGTFSEYHDYLAMLPKGTDRYLKLSNPCTLNFVTLNRVIENQRPRPCQLNCYLNRVFNCHYSKCNFYFLIKTATDVDSFVCHAMELLGREWEKIG